MPLLPPWLHILYILTRWIHLVAMTLLVGGILFFEFVVPLAVEDLQDAQRHAVFGRARWVFRKVIWVSLACIIVTGVILTQEYWRPYRQLDQPASSPWMKTTLWFAAHAVVGVLGMLMAFRLTSGRWLLAQPVRWMKMTLVVLFFSIFFAAVTRYVYLCLHDNPQGTLGVSTHH